MFTMGCTGLAAAASFTIDQTSCFCPATRRAGLNFSAILDVEDTLRRVEIPVRFDLVRFLLPVGEPAMKVVGRIASWMKGRETERMAAVEVKKLMFMGKRERD
jgi:hypothetical protein